MFEESNVLAYGPVDDGFVDYGYIDVFQLCGDGFVLDGEWGRPTMTSGDIAIEVLGP